MAANSENSRKTGVRRTEPEPLGKAEALEIMQSAVNECVRSGWRVAVDNLYNGPAMIVIPGAAWRNGDLVIADYTGKVIRDDQS